MARKSRKLSRERLAEKPGENSQKNVVGIYTRLSVEDNGYDTKDSIQNQIAFLRNYVEEYSDEFELGQIYVDNGSTGTNFERAEWNRMMKDIKSQKINCIVIKDFSRMGRNYIEVGNYLEKIFPFLGIRVIAVNENFDSKKNFFDNSMLMNSLTNIVNEYYARDISKKVIQAKRTMQKRGEYASGIVPYGYFITEDRRLTVDSESAEIVKKIFAWRVMGKGCGVIANYLNELVVPSPGLYRYMNGDMRFKRSCNVKWKSKHVAAILINPLYLGHMAQGRTHRSYFEQDGKMRMLPKEDWTVVENMHEALVSQEQFNIVGVMAEKSRNRYYKQLSANENISHIDNPLKKKIVCGQCGSHMIRRSRVKNQDRDYSFSCVAPRMKTGVHCMNTHIHEVPLMEAVGKAVDQYLRAVGIWENRGIIDKYSKFIKKGRDLDARKRALEESIALIRKQRQELYADLKEGILSTVDYEYEKKQLTDKQTYCEQELETVRNKSIAEEKTENILREYRSHELSVPDKEISLDMLDMLVDKIAVFSPEKVEVSFSFADMLKEG